ncbi:MAG: RNA polymerase factor sigma-54 [Sphingomonadales bacterium]
MALTPRLDLRQSQQLVMTPQLQQAIKLLQLNNLELTGFLAEELERNPLLEMGEERAEPAAEANGADTDRSAQDGTESNASSEDGDIQIADSLSGGGDAALDGDFNDNLYDSDAAIDRVASADSAADGLTLSGAGLNGSSGGGASTAEGSGNVLEETVSTGQTLQEFLSEQVPHLLKVQSDRLIAGHLVDLVDEAGYLHEPLDAIAERLSCDVDDVEAVLLALQSCEPTGVFARCLAECLKLQQRDQDRLDPVMDVFLDHLDLVGKRDIPALKRVCGVDEEDILDMIREIQRLDPRPGLTYGGGVAEPVEPDVFVRRGKDGIWHVELNSQTLPRVLVNQRYYAQLAGNSKTKEAKTFLSECLSSANWLVKALDQRAQTILKVSTELVRQQEAFFEHGVRYLRPLNLRVIAEAINMHESTVSRVTSNKFLATERGLYELKYFFTSAIQAADGTDAHSAEAVRDRIKSLIDDEDPFKVLSDDAIVDLLVDEGIDIARRTVAKYREAMNIPSSVQRRRFKKIAVSA